MPRSTMPEILTAGLEAHPAVQAWLQVQSDSWESGSLEVLQRRRYSTVYRINPIRQGGARVIAKRCRGATARIERMIYEELLPLAGMPALGCYGLLEEPGSEFCWLFLEDAAGARYSPELPRDRALAGCWLAEAQLAAVRADFKSCLPDRDLDHYLRLLRSCRAMLLRHLDAGALPLEDAAVFRNIATRLDELEFLWDELAKICEVMPRTLVHGDFVIKNLRVRETPKGPALLVFDWEFAGWGVPAADLAQFLDRTASPDLGLYCTILNREHFDLDLRDLQAVAACGNLLRLVDQVSWATSGCELVSAAKLVKAIDTLRFYEPSLSGALKAFRRR